MNKVNGRELVEKKGYIFHHFLDFQQLFVLVLTMPNFHGFGVFSIQDKKLVVPMKYDDAFFLGKNSFLVERNEKCGIFSIKKGRFVVPMETAGYLLLGRDVCVIMKGAQYNLYSSDEEKFIETTRSADQMKEIIRKYL